MQESKYILKVRNKKKQECKETVLKHDMVKFKTLLRQQHMNLSGELPARKTGETMCKKYCIPGFLTKKKIKYLQEQ